MSQTACMIKQIIEHLIEEKAITEESLRNYMIRIDYQQRRKQILTGGEDRSGSTKVCQIITYLSEQYHLSERMIRNIVD